MGKWVKSGSPWIWMTGGAVSISLIAVLGLLLLIAWRGLSFFWPATIYQWELEDSSGVRSTLIGEIYDREEVPTERLTAAGHVFKQPPGEFVTRYLVKTGNREFVGLDFRWILATDIISRSEPADVAMLERTKNGNFYGYPVAVIENGKRLELKNDALESSLMEHIDRAVALSDKALSLQKQDIGSINYNIEKLRLKERRYELDGELTDSRKQELAAAKHSLEQDYKVLEKQLFALLKLAEHFSGESRQLFEISLDPEWEQHKSAILEVLDVEPLQLPELAELLHRQQISTIYSV
mgnify:CR=1 FL=1